MLYDTPPSLYPLPPPLAISASNVRLIGDKTRLIARGKANRKSNTPPASSCPRSHLHAWIYQKPRLLREKSQHGFNAGPRYLRRLSLPDRIVLS